MTESFQIVLVGGQLLPVALGLKEFPQDKIILISTRESQTKLNFIRPFVKERLQKELTCNPFDFESVYTCLSNSLNVIPDSHQVKINLTGGTKIMLLAAQKILTERNVTGFYINQDNSLIEIPAFRVKELAATLTAVEFFRLSGHQLSTYRKISDFEEADLQAAEALYNFSLQNWKIYSSISNFLYQLDKQQRPIPSSATYVINPSLKVIWTDNTVTIKSFDKEIFNHSSKHIQNLFFKTGWWELFVATKTNKWKGAKEIFLQAELPFKANNSLTKNEIDILVNLGSKLLFIECKSGTVKNEDINKMKVIRDTYGGAIAKSILVTKYTPPQNIFEKCQELGIEVYDVFRGKFKKNDLDRFPNFLDKVAKKLSI